MIVMKFGGTSVQDAKAIERAAAIVQERLAQKPVVVVSAMAKVTDQLLAMARAAGNCDRKNALKLCRALQERHYDTAGELLGTALFTRFHGDLATDFETLDDLLRGIAAVGELTPRTTDYVAAFGELLSSRIVTAAFSALGMDSSLVDSRECIVTDTAHTRAAPLFEETNERLRSKVSPLLTAGKVPVMGGFIGSTKAGITTTIGRGGSDYSAAIVGAGLDAERIEIWTDVDGMMTTDPNLCRDARRIKIISFDEAAVDVVTTSEVSVSLTLDSTESIPALAADLSKLADVKYEGRKAIVCLVGENLRDTPGIVGCVFSELNDVNIRMISQGASEINLTFVIEEDAVPEVVRRLHKKFFSDLDPEVFA